MFSEIIKQHFRYLTENYNFILTEESYSPETMGNAEIIFASAHCQISIVSDRGQILMNVGTSSLPRQEWLEFSQVVHTFAPQIESVYIFPQDILDHQVALEEQAQRLSGILYKYCKPLLKAEISVRQIAQTIHEKQIKNVGAA